MTQLNPKFLAALKARSAKIQDERNARAHDNNGFNNPPDIEYKPEPYKTYALTGPNSIAAGNSWKESEVKNPPVIPPAPIPIAEPLPVDAYSLYKQQVSQLTEHFNIDPADLTLKAIDTLYRDTFKFN